MDTVRAFIAVEIGQRNKKTFSDIISRLQKSNAEVRWITKGQLHLTLKFLGAVDKNKIPVISETLKNIADDFSVFAIDFSEIGAFPDTRKPKVIWAGIDRNADTLKKLFEKVESGLEESGFKKEKRRYKAHLTLGRVKSLKNIESLRQLIEKESSQKIPGETSIDKLILFQSRLTPKGAIYTPLSTHTLRAGSA